MVGSHPPRFPQIPSFWECGPVGDRVPSPNTTTSTTTTLPAAHHFDSNAVMGAQQRVRNFMDGIISPFRACVQPPVQSCCATPAHVRKQIAENWNSPPPLNVNVLHYQQQREPQCIKTPNENDVLCGRGGSSNKHKGNINFRELIAANRGAYAGLTKKQKMLMARQIVDVVHHTDPPGRFLARDVNSGYFYDVGLPRSLEKTSQALRDKHNGEQRGNEETMMDIETTGCDEAAVENSKTKSGRKVQTPDLIIPPHLMHIYKHPNENSKPPVHHPYTPAPPAVHSVMEHYRHHPEPPHAVHTPLPYNSYSPAHHPAAITPSFSPPPHFADRHHMMASSIPPKHRMGFVNFTPPPHTISSSSGTSSTTHATFNSSSSVFIPPEMVSLGQLPPVDEAMQIPRLQEDLSSQMPSVEIGLVESPDDEIDELVLYSHNNNNEQGWKRRRMSASPRNTSSNVLHHAVECQLTLEERVVGGPRRGDLISPSGALQGRQHSRLLHRSASMSSTNSTNPMDGLAALSAAAYLRLDETE